MLGEPTTDRISQRREATKREILDAAWQVIGEEGVAALSLREVARRVGMKAPSLYGYFESKEAIYDAMFAEGWRMFREHAASQDGPVTAEDMKLRLERMIQFADDHPALYQLCFQRSVPGFKPSAEAYAESLATYEDLRKAMADLGVTEQWMLDLWTATSGGLMSQQISNDPGGDRWRRLAGDAVEMFLQYVRPRTRGGKGSKG